MRTGGLWLNFNVFAACCTKQDPRASFDDRGSIFTYHFSLKKSILLTYRMTLWHHNEQGDVNRSDRPFAPFRLPINKHTVKVANHETGKPRRRTHPVDAGLVAMRGLDTMLHQARRSRIAETCEQFFTARAGRIAPRAYVKARASQAAQAK